MRTASKSDEFSAIVSHSSFLCDLIRAFNTRSNRDEVPIDKKDGTDDDFEILDSDAVVDDEEDKKRSGGNNLNKPRRNQTVFQMKEDQWFRVWRQFELDIQRENFILDGERYLNPGAAYAALITLFETYEEEDKKRNHTNPKLKKDEGKKGQEKSGGLWSWVSSLLSSQRSNTKVQSPTKKNNSQEEEEEGGPPDDVLPKKNISSAESLARLVILHSQQSVLAVPYELIHRQFTIHCEEDIFLGEPHRDCDELPSQAATSASGNVQVKKKKSEEELDSTRDFLLVPSRSGSNKVDFRRNCSLHRCPRMTVEVFQETARGEGGPCEIVVVVSKTFRVFSIIDSTDYTLFEVDVRLEFLPALAEDDVVLRWKAREPPALEIQKRRQLHNNKLQPVAIGDRRLCECLGGPCGYHKSCCSLYVPK